MVRRPRRRQRAAATRAALLVASIGLVLVFVPSTLAVFGGTDSEPANTFATRASFGLTQLSGTAGCTSEDGTSGACADGTNLKEMAGMVMSPDGAHVYAVSYIGDAVLSFSRNTSTGELTQLTGTSGCTSETGTSGACVDGKALDGPWGLDISPDGAHVYVASYYSDAVAVFSRDSSTGALTQLAGTAGCTSETGTSGTCVDGQALGGADDVAVSPDGAYVYVASYDSNAVAVFSRDSSTGALTQLSGTAGCTSETGTSGACVDGTALVGAVDLAISPDPEGSHLYAVNAESDSIAVFSRSSSTGAITQLSGTSGCVSETGTSGACVDGKSLDGAYGMAISADGISVYVAGSISDGVAVFSRNTSTGVLTQLAGTDGCISETGTGGACIDGRALDGVQGVAVSPDGQDVYAASIHSDAIAVLWRDATTGAVSQPSATRGCISETGTAGTCLDGKALDSMHRVLVSVDGSDVYSAGGVSPTGFVSAFSRSR